ncbi:MAG TPA: HD domain-containing phosphohydrolase [Gemmatimonadales bacterium]
MPHDTGFRCLVVDDQQATRHVLVRALQAMGHACLDADSGPAALEILHRTTIEVLMSDIRMPGMDGVDLLQAVRRDHPDVAVIMLTGVTEVETAVWCLRAGAFDYIVKPFEMDEVRARVDQALEKRRLILDNRRYQMHLSELVEQQAARIEELFLEGIQSIVHALEAKDTYTQGHSVRVASYAAGTGRMLGLADEELRLLTLGAELHDVGKIGVSEAILNKPDRLTDDEYQHIMQHTVIGARILDPLMHDVPQVLGIVRSHHERINGTGLPDGLRGDAIPPLAKLVSVVDAFDAMTSGRSYRPALTADAAIAELRANAGTQFDPRMVEAFLAAYPDCTALPIDTPASAVPRAAPRAATLVPGASVQRGA